MTPRSIDAIKGEMPAFPAYLTDESDGPQPVPDVPLWSENYLTQIYDPAQEVGFYFHFARMPFNYDVWEGVFTCYLPRDRFLVARDFSSGAGPAGPGTNALQFRVVDPFKTWNKRFRGAAQLVTGDQLRAGPLVDDGHVYVEMDLTWSAISPQFDLGQMGEQFWASAHYEQHGAVTGTISYDGRTLGKGSGSFEINCTGFRDHSVGPRDIAKMSNHVFLSGQFPSGRNFMVMDLRTKAGYEDFTYIVVGDHERMVKVDLLDPTPFIDDPAEIFQPYGLRFEAESGPSVIKAQILQAAVYSFTGPNECIIGAHPDAHHYLLESQTRYDWEGEIGYGLTERSVEVWPTKL